MNPKRWTAIILLTLVFTLSLYDFVIYHYGGSEATISLVILRGSLSYPIIPFLAGVLAGHLFAPLAKYPVVPAPLIIEVLKHKPNDFHELDDIA